MQEKADEDIEHIIEMAARESSSRVEVAEDQD